MAGKKKKVDNEAIADFFGGDVEWLDEDDETASISPDPSTGEELPVAPLSSESYAPPPPRFAEPAPLSDPTAIPDAPTDVVGEAVVPVARPPAPPLFDNAPRPAPPPTLPPTPDMWDEATEELAAQDPRGEGLGERDPPTLEVDPTSEEVLTSSGPTISLGEPPVRTPPPAPTAAPEPPAPEVDASESDFDWEQALGEAEPVVGDDLEATGQTPAPLVHTHEPVERRAGADAPPDLSFGAPAADDPAQRVTRAAASPRYVPLDEPDAWRAAARSLVAEAAIADAGHRGELLFWAARIYRRRLGDGQGAQTLLMDALSAGFDDAMLHRERASTVLALEWWRDAEDAFGAQAETLQGAARSEALQDAAAMAAQRGDRAAAVEHLEQAIQADPTDCIALSLLQDRLAASSEVAGRIPVLDRMADLYPDGPAAEVLWEKGVLLRELDEVAAAREAWQAALARWPAHAPAFLSLRASYLETGDDAGRASLYEREANRAGQSDAGFWYLKAARAWQDAGQDQRADSMYTAAVGLGYAQARREQQAWFLRRARYDAFAGATRDEIRREKRSQAQAFAWWRLGAVLERHLDDRPGAREAYLKAAELDPAAEPAREAAARLTEGAEGGAELLLRWEAEAAGAEGEALATLQLRIAELATVLGDVDRARAAWDALTGYPSTARVALDARIALEASAGTANTLSEAVAAAAAAEPDPAPKAALLTLSVTPGLPGPDAGKTLQAALDLDPTSTVARIALESHLRKTADPAAITALLVNAAEAVSDADREARLYYRAARVARDLGGDDEAAAELVANALHADPSLLAAKVLDGDLAASRGASRELYLSLRERARNADAAAPRHWWHLAAAGAAEGVDALDPESELLAVLDEAPAHPGALAAWELRFLAVGDRSKLAEGYRDSAEHEKSVRRRAERVATLADLRQEMGDEDGARGALRELAGYAAPKAPMRAAARLAAAQHDWKEATALLKRAGAPEDFLERARILGHYQNDVPAALTAYRALLQRDEVRVAAAYGMLQVARAAADVPAALEAHQVLADAGDEPFRAGHHAWAADLLEEAGNASAALASHREVLSRRPASRTTFDALRRLLVGDGDGDGLRALYVEYRPDDLRGLAEDLESADLHDQALDVWDRAVKASELKAPLLIELEQAQRRHGDWRALYDTLSRRAAAVHDESVKASIEAQRRWLLADKLADTDEAWDLYRRLREEDPNDRHVAEALAGIAAERGETALAIEYLEELSASATDGDEAARYKRRIAQAWEKAGEPAHARQAYLDALDFVRDDADALDGLKRLAGDAGDHEALVAVLRRESSLVGRERRVEVLRQVARITEGELSEPGLAVDAWREVLEEDDTDVEALGHLVALGRDQGNWAVFVEAGHALSRRVEGVERANLLRDLGKACEAHLDRDPVQFFEAAITNDPPSLEAAGRLQEVYEQRNDWSNAVRLLKIRAGAGVPEAERANLLARAAHIEAEVHHERDLAAEIYQEVLSIAPDHPAALAYVANWLYDQGRLHDAIPVFERLEPNATEGRDLEDFDTRIDVALEFYRFGQMLEKVRRHGDAMARYERALDLNPTHLPSLEAVAPLYTRFSHWRRAEKAYRKLLQLTGGTGDKGQLASTYAKLGRIERELGNRDKAFKRFNKALELEQTNVRALKGMALIYEDRKDWDNCMKSYNNIIYHATERADVIDAYMSKGRVLDDELARRDKAAEHYQRSLDVEPNQPAALLRLAELSLREQNWAEAESHAHRGLKFAVDGGAVRADLLLCWAAARQRRGDDEAARSAVAEAVSLRPELAKTLGEDPLGDVDALAGEVHARF